MRLKKPYVLCLLLIYNSVSIADYIQDSHSLWMKILSVWRVMEINEYERPHAKINTLYHNSIKWGLKASELHVSCNAVLLSAFGFHYSVLTHQMPDRRCLKGCTSERIGSIDGSWILLIFQDSHFCSCQSFTSGYNYIMFYSKLLEYLFVKKICLLVWLCFENISLMLLW